MAKHLNISLGVTADTSKAKAQLQDLQNQLTKIINSPTSDRLDLAKQIREASQAAAELQAHLKNATNVDTGTLDFTKLSSSLKQSGQSLESYAQKLVKIGPEGRQAFQQLTTSVAQSEIPIKRVNKQLDEMWTTLKNSARWQISSSILHGFMGAVQSAHGYAQDLNESLTNIRIVTGQNTDQMAKFAKQANAAAKALSTTTTNYTNASLIYYQQGLSDEEVKKRTDITIKMANAAGASAETVSDQLTAVWNNFYDGTKSLEHYADVMTALGAATASSTDEIAGGLEKFAAVADTIGLSYEYAASALATITSNTRQSEEVVGTALKTIFARIQGLNLGETLEDGTSLNKYSEALAKVGIDIFETNGQIKEMDNILDELGAKWQQLGKDQQIALAQTVAGVRQYNQLVSLMDNWNNGDNDSFQANMETARNSTGALQEQADIYAEGWEAASDRVRASLEGVYDTIMDDDAFITILDGLAEIIQYTDRLIDGMGGLGGVVSTIGAVATKVFSKQMAQQLRDTSYSLSMMTKDGKEKYRRQKREEVDKLTGMASSLQSKSKTEETKAWATGIENSAKLRTILEQNSANMTPEQIKVAQARIEAAERTAKDVEESARKFDESKATGKKLHDEVLSTTRKKAIFLNPEDSNEVKKQVNANDKAYKELEQKYRQYYSQLRRIDEIIDTETIDKDTANRMNQLATDLKEILSSDFDLIDPELGGTVTQSIREDFLRLKEIIEDEIENDIANLGLFDDDLKQKIKENIKTQGSDLAETEQKKENQEEEQKENEKFIEEQGNEGRVYDWADKATAVADAALSLTSAIQALGGIKDILSDDTLSDWDKFSSIVSVMAMNVPMVITSFTQLSTVFGGMTGIANSVIGVATKLNPAFMANAASAGVATTGVAGLTTALGALWSAAWPFIALAAAFGGAIYLLNQHLTKEKQIAEEAAKSAKNLAEAYDLATEAHNNFKNTLDDYKEAKKGLNDLIKGTEEYRQVLQQTNDLALQLIENNPDLSNQYEFVDGVIQFNENALENIEQQKLNQKNQAYATSIYAKQESNEAEIEAQKARFKNGDPYQGFDNDEIYNKLLSAYQKDSSLFDKIEAKEFDEVASMLDVSSKVVESALYRNVSSLEKLVIAMNNNEKTQQINNTLMAEAQFGNQIDETGLRDSSQNLLASLLGNKLSNVADSKKIEFNEEIGAVGRQQFVQRYAAERGYTTDYAGFGNAVFKDSEGNEVDTLSQKDLESIYTYQRALEEVTKEFPDLTNIVKEGTKNLTDTQIEALSSFANGEIGDLSKLTADEYTKLKDNLSEGLKNALNIDVEDINTAIKNVEEATHNFTNSLWGSVKQSFFELDTSNISLEAQKNIASILEQAFHEGGYEGLDSATTLFKIAGDNAGKVAEIVSSIDWQTTTAEEFNQKLENAGIILPNASGALAEFVNWIKRTADAATAATNSDFYNQTQEILKQMVAGGSISEEQMTALRESENANIKAMADLFSYQADGSYAYKGTNADAYKAEQTLNQAYYDNFQNSAEYYGNRANQLQNLSNVDLEELTTGRNSSELASQRVLAIDELIYDSLDETTQNIFNEIKAKVLDKQQLSTEESDTLKNIISENSNLYNEERLNSAIEDNQFEATKNMQAQYSTATSIEDLNEMREGFKGVAGEAEAYRKQVQEINNIHLAEELGVEREALNQVAEEYMEIAKAAGVNASEAVDLAYSQAERYFRQQSGLENIIDNWKTYSNVIKDIGTDNQYLVDNVQNINELRSALSDIVGVSKDDALKLFDDKWLKDNKKTLQKLAEGSEDAINDIKAQFEEERSMQLICEIEGEVDYSAVDEAGQAIHDEVMRISNDNSIKIGAKIDNEQYLAGLNEMFAKAGWTSAQIQKYMQEMGFDVEITTHQVPLSADIPIPTMGSMVVQNDGAVVDNYQGGLDFGSGGQDIHHIEGFYEAPAIKVITKTGEYGGGGSTNTQQHGGSDEPTQMEYTKEIDFYERYKEWDDALDDIADVLSDVQKKEDALYGQNKIAAMKNRNSLLLKEVEALQQKKKEAEAYFEIDKQNLQNAAGALGYQMNFGSRDQILNYTSTMQSLFDELHAMEVHFNSLGSGKAQQAYKKNVLDPFNQKVDDLKQYIDQYDETRELIEDLENDIDDSLYEWKGLNYEILHYEMEIKIEINDLALTRLDYYLEKLEGDFYSVSEAAAYLTSRFEPVLNKLAAYEELYRDTTKMWDSTTQLYGDIMEGVDETIHQSNEERLDAMSGGLVGAFTGNGVVKHDPTDFYTQTEDGVPIAVGEEGYINALDRDITQADYVEGLYESFEGIFEELGELVDMDKQMMEFYANAIEMAREELEFYTDSLEHLTNALKHYHKVADITGRTNDYGFMGKMLEAQSAAIENELSVASSNYEMWKQQKAYWEAQLLTAEEGTKQWEFYKENLDAAVKATEEAQEEMLSKTEEWAESLRAILEHELGDAARILENALTGGTSFDTMNTALERAESLQEEYLTDTNKIYETTKLMRQAQQQIDKTNNNNAKLRLNMFITETEQLQQQNRLSEYELSIQQAKYQLLLAELALEEAKNAKSTVRLKRDFEGNFGYVYTADQEQIDDALQNLDDKRNELYNIGLEGANNYTSKYLQTLQAMYDEFTTIQQNYLEGMYESEEEYQNALLDAYDYYYEQLKNYEELYGIAIRADSRVTADAWSTDFQDMIYSTEIWADECDIYITQVTELFEEWAETSEDLNQILDNTTGTIDEIVRASDELAASINDHVVPGLQQELDLLNEILRAYGLIRDKVFEDINHYEDTADEIYDDIVEEAERNDYEDEEFEQEYPEEAERVNTPAASSPSGGKANPETGGRSAAADAAAQAVMNAHNNQSGFMNQNQIKADLAADLVDGGDGSYYQSQLDQIKRREEEIESKLGWDTGGYTGSWGPAGKWAILHEKEIVLNKSDTENILQAVDMVRQISTGIDEQASYQRIATLITQTLQDKREQEILEQHVTIEARFDNVRDRYEIEAAFDNLINKASQYANRNKI